MSDFLLRLAERTLGQAVRVQPLISSRYSSEPEAQKFSDHFVEDSRDAAQPPTKFSNSVTPGGRPRDESSPQDESPQNGAGQNIPTHLVPSERHDFHASLIADLPSIVSGTAAGVFSTDNRQAKVASPSGAEMLTAIPGSAASAGTAVRRGMLPAEGSPASTLLHRINDLSGTDQFDTVSGRLASAPAARHQATSAQHERLPSLQSRTPLIPSHQPESTARKSVSDVVSQPVNEQSVRSSEFADSTPDRQAAWLDRGTDPVRVGSDRIRAEQSVIRVTIGRIDVRASVTTKSPQPTPVQPPAMTLDDYLQRRQGGR